MIKFSIIIPVYNAEKTLRRCLDSILDQSFGNFEVLLVDDGSTDDSGQICEEYQKKDNRFCAYHQENQGPSAARNHGLDRAMGDWVCFVDSDDTVSCNYLEIIYRRVIEENPEVIFLGYQQLDAEGKVINEKLPDVKKTKAFELLLELSQRDMFGYTWIKTVKRAAIGKTRFREELNLFEDEVFACEILSGCERVSCLERPIYQYYTGASGALTHRTHENYCEKCGQVFSAWKELLRSYDDSDSVLLHKANLFVERCRYYGFERDVKVKSFFAALADTEYFAMHNQRTQFDEYVQSHNYAMIWIERQIYRWKVRMAKLIRR